MPAFTALHDAQRGNRHTHCGNPVFFTVQERDNMTIQTSVRRSQVEVIDTPACERDSEEGNSCYDEKHGQNCIAGESSCNQQQGRNNKSCTRPAPHDNTTPETETTRYKLSCGKTICPPPIAANLHQCADGSALRTALVVWPRSLNA